MMASSLPLITVGLTCYNAAATIGRAIDGALAQTYPNKEIIIVDDGSSDGSRQVIEEKIRGKLECRLIIHDPNRGFPSALNSIIEHANGEFVAIFDDDDESLPQRLTVQSSEILRYEQKTGLSLIACHASRLRIYDNEYQFLIPAIGSQNTVPCGDSIADYLLFFGRRQAVFYGGGTPSCSLMCRTEVFRALGGYDPDLRKSEDTDFAVRLGFAGGCFIGTEQALIHQYVTNGHDKRPLSTYRSYDALLDKHRLYLESRGRYTYAKLWHLLRFYHFSGDRFRALAVLTRLTFRHPLWTWSHFLASAPKRLLHELKINRKG